MEQLSADSYASYTTVTNENCDRISKKSHSNILQMMIYWFKMQLRKVSNVIKKNIRYQFSYSIRSTIHLMQKYIFLEEQHMCINIDLRQYHMNLVETLDVLKKIS